MAIEQFTGKDAPKESVTETVKANVPAMLGMPDAVPEAALSERPVGRTPDAMEKA
jgi:hypothetical protein